MMKQTLKSWKEKLPYLTRGLWKKQGRILILSLFFCFLSFYQSIQNSPLQQGYFLTRGENGGESKSYELLVKGLDKNTMKIPVEVSPRCYTRKQCLAIFSLLKKELPYQIFQEGDSFDGVSGDLRLPSRFSSYPGVTAHWSFLPEKEILPEGESAPSHRSSVDPDRRWKEKEDPHYRLWEQAESIEENSALSERYRELVTESGEIRHELLPDGALLDGTLYLTLEAEILRDSVTSAAMENDSVPPEASAEDEHAIDSRITVLRDQPLPIFLRIKSGERTETERLLRIFRKQLSESDLRTLSEKKYQLPNSVQGRRLSYQSPQSHEYFFFPLLGLAAAILLYLKEVQTAKQATAQRERSLLLNYSDLVSELLVYLSAGLSTRNSFQTISAHYDRLVKDNIHPDRPLYQELRKTCADLSRNMPEGDAYQHFSERIHLKEYTKLISLIEQNRKNGTKQLSSFLQAEMQDALSVRRNTARRLGEEAATKLLFPLIMQLAIVMLIILFPAMTLMA